MEAQSVRLALIDRSAGYEATPGRAKLSILVDFASDVKAFLRGETKEIDPAQLDVAIREGRLRSKRRRYRLAWPSLATWRSCQLANSLKELIASGVKW